MRLTRITDHSFLKMLHISNSGMEFLKIEKSAQAGKG